MLIEVDDEKLTLAGRSFSYSAYYFEFTDVPNLTSATALKLVLRQWKNVLMESLGTGRTLFLPYSLEDEWVECFRAILSGEMVSLTETHVDENGWAVRIDDLRNFMLSPHNILKESSTPCISLLTRELIEALSIAETI
jgi:hypothetical protein